jgi:hypothetical protein
MVLFGKEFDADERPEVGGGLRGVEGDSNRPAVRFCWLTVPLRKNGLQKGIRVGKGNSGH